MDVRAWLANACADADARGLPELKPLLETLARATQGLRDRAAEDAAADHAAYAEQPERDDETAR